MRSRKNIVRVQFRDPPEFEMRHIDNRAVVEVRGKVLADLKVAAAVAGVTPHTLLRRALCSVFSERP
jgi:hypothetical protein